MTDYEIEQGSVAMTSGGVRFETTKKAVLLKGETYVDVPASAVEAGASGNAIAGAIHLMSVYPVGITQCTNPEAFSGGSDEESDEKLRERVLASYKRLPNGANAAFYEQEAMSFPNVAAAKAVGRARGIGTVDGNVSTHAGAPDEKLLGEIEAVLQKKREIAVDVEVKAPTEKTVNARRGLTAEQGWTCHAGDLPMRRRRRCRQPPITSERLGEAVYTAKLCEHPLRCGGREELPSAHTERGCERERDGAAGARHGDDHGDRGG
ncbi:MAG: baseplate J/gp47 family protein [Oscillibacter sp.]